jgi:hypothetical protein
LKLDLAPEAVLSLEREQLYPKDSSPLPSRIEIEDKYYLQERISDQEVKDLIPPFSKVSEKFVPEAKNLWQQVVLNFQRSRTLQ